MIRQDKHDRAIDAIGRVIVHARVMAYTHACYDDLVNVLDVAEYLPTLFLRNEDMTDHFREALHDLSEKYLEMFSALERFDRP